MLAGVVDAHIEVKFRLVKFQSVHQAKPEIQSSLGIMEVKLKKHLRVVPHGFGEFVLA